MSQKRGWCLAMYLIPIFRPIGPFMYQFYIFPPNIFFSKFCRFGKKKCDYWSQKPGFLPKISKILEINKNHPNTYYVKILGHLEHFWPFFWAFLAIFEPFLALLIYKGTAGRALYPSRVFLRSSGTARPISLKFCMSQEEMKGYQIE